MKWYYSWGATMCSAPTASTLCMAFFTPLLLLPPPPPPPLLILVQLLLVLMVLVFPTTIWARRGRTRRGVAVEAGSVCVMLPPCVPSSPTPLPAVAVTVKPPPQGSCSLISSGARRMCFLSPICCKLTTKTEIRMLPLPLFSN